MKKHLQFFILFFFIFGSAFSNSKDLNFGFELKNDGELLLKGSIKSHTRTSHTKTLSGCNDHSSKLGCVTQSCITCSGADFAFYEVVSTTSIVFSQNDLSINLPDFFSNLLGSGSNDLHHSFYTNYILRVQTTTTARNLAGLLLCIFCFPCCLGYEIYTNGNSHQSEFSKIEALENSVPNRLLKDVRISKRSLSHERTSNGCQLGSSPDVEITGNNIYIFDMFLNTPETQQWIIDHLAPNTNVTLDLVIPELFNSASTAQVVVQESSDEYDSDNITPSHYMTFNMSNGIKLQYHLKKTHEKIIQVLAIVITYNNYNLTLIVDNYDVQANQPPPNYAELSTICPCGGACAHFRKDDSDDSDKQSDTRPNHAFFPPRSY